MRTILSMPLLFSILIIRAFICLPVAYAQQPLDMPALAEKYNERVIDDLLMEVLRHDKELGSFERREFVRLASDRNVATKHKENLLTITFMTLRKSPNRASEVNELYDSLVTMLDFDGRIPELAIGCIVFGFESEEKGAEREAEWLEKIQGKSEARQLEFLFALGNTKWLRPPMRFECLGALYADEKKSLQVREAIVDLIFVGMLSGELEWRDGCIYYRELAKKPTHNAQLTSKMFTRLSDIGEAARVIRKIKGM